MTNRTDTTDFKHLILNDIPLLDVRAPIEFDQGAFPKAFNVPLLDDKQRELIGKKYKDAGQDEAIKLGTELITPDLKEQRLQQWGEFCINNTEGYLYCFRGGLRSRITQQWLADNNVAYPYVKGGYKALRRYLIDELENSIKQIPFIRVAGRTGSGKTHVLLKIRHYLDFEGIAQHKGSAFGRNVHDSQPTPINFENEISIQMLKHRENYPDKTLYVEDEGRMIGRCVMTDNLHKKMIDSPSIVLLENNENRVKNITQDYVDDLWPDYQRVYKEQAEEKYAEFFLSSLERIQKRLGLERYKDVNQHIEKGLKSLFEDKHSDDFSPAFDILLTQYYDPMYDYQMTKRDGHVLFEGNFEEIIEWSKHH